MSNRRSSGCFVIAACAAMGVGVVAGCQSPPATAEASDHPAVVEAHDLQSPPASLLDGSARYEQREPHAHAMVVGLYGENWAGTTPVAGSEGDGNLMQVSFAPEGGDFTPDVERSGAFLVYASRQHSERFDIYRKTVEGRTVTQLTADAADDIMPVLSPDGSHVAFASNRNGNWDVFVMPTVGGPATQVTFESDDEVQPTWSPEGDRLAFARMNRRTSRWEIWTAGALVPSAATYLTDGFLPRWSPAGSQSAGRTKLLFQRARQQGSRLYGVWTIDLINGEAANPTEIVSAQNEAIIQPNWSPDGTRIVYTSVVRPGEHGSDMPERSNLWTVRVDGTGRKALTSGHFRNMQAVWGPDDRIYFVSNRSGIENLWSVSPDVATGPEVSGSLAGAGAAVETGASDPDNGQVAGHGESKESDLPH